MTEAVQFLQHWYATWCDGDWEHDHRVRISTIDNPGWRLWVNLSDTDLEGRVLPRVVVERSDMDWLIYKSDGQEFDVACGARNLEEALVAFREFVEAKK